MTKLTDTRAIVACDTQVGDGLASAAHSLRTSDGHIVKAAVAARALGYTPLMFTKVGTAPADTEASDAFALDVREKIASKLPKLQRECIALSGQEIGQLYGDNEVEQMRAQIARKEANKVYVRVLDRLRAVLTEIASGTRNAATGALVALPKGSSEKAGRAGPVKTLQGKVERFDEAVRAVDMVKLNLSNDQAAALQEALDRVKRANIELNRVLNAIEASRKAAAAAGPDKAANM
jgi:hypothetical protein